MNWFRIILDEAHTIKDRATRTAKATFALRAERRWCVTGTPIQNKYDDLFSLLHFLQVKPYGDLDHWNSQIMKPIRNKDEKGSMILQGVLELILLRRTKDQRIGGVPIVSLPPRIIKLHAFEFREEESDFYQSLWSQSKTKFNDYINTGSVLKNYAHILELLLRLRQACNHPFLVLSSKKHSSTDHNLEVSSLVSSFLRERNNSNSTSTSTSSSSTILTDIVNKYGDEDCMICLDLWRTLQ